MLKDMRGSRTDMDFMVADFENGDNAKEMCIRDSPQSDHRIETRLHHIL